MRPFIQGGSTREGFLQPSASGKLKLISTFAIGITSSVAAAALVYVVTSAGLLSTLLVGFAVLATSLGYIIGFSSGRRSSITGLAGVLRITTEPSDKLSLAETLPHLNSQFAFWGISAKRTIASAAFRLWLQSLSQTQQRAKFLILDPDSPNLQRKASDEGDSAEAWRREIAATITRINDMARQYPGLIEVRTYTEFPIWRVIFVDEQLAIVNYFPSGKQGPESPQIVLHRKGDSFFEPLYKEFCEMWEYRSKRFNDAKSPSS